MSYVPPHKRHSNDAVRTSPVLESVMCPGNCPYRWFLVRSNGTEGEITQSVQFERVSIESAEWRGTEKPLVLVNCNAKTENIEVRATEVRSLCVSIVEKVEDDLLLAFEKGKNRVVRSVPEVVKLRLVARFGKSLFNGHPEMSVANLKDELVAESKVIKSKKWLHTNLPSSYMEKVKFEAASKIGLQIEETKDIYHMMLFDEHRPDKAIWCKCTVKEDKWLKMYKVEGSAEKHLVVDLSCLDQNLDLRLTVDSKKILTAESEDEVKSMEKLIDAAIIDPNVKGGLRWPLGKASSGDRFSVCSVWHTITTSYSNSDSTLRLNVREADRSNFMTGTGETAREVFLKMKGISANLQEEKVEKSLISDKLKYVLGKIWDNFLSCDPFLT